MTKKGRVILWVCVALIALAVIGAGAGMRWWRWASEPAAAAGAKDKAVRITVPGGASASAVGKDLEAQGIVRSARVFALRARDKTIQPGVYDISPAESPAAILSRLVKGDIATNRVTFPEGYTLERMAERIEEKQIGKAEPFLQVAAREGNTLKAASFTPPANLEGYLFPDTYKFPVDADEKAIAQRMLDNFDRLVAQGKEDEIKKSGRSLHEIVTIASLIEREARVSQDREKIAGVIYNRLNRKMPLQIDATVQYARGEHKARLLYRDLKVDSPYNTYRIVGLPPGPICSPGLASIEAALNPESSEYLYYVARSDGSHVFGKTLAEHNRNIAFVRREAAAGAAGRGG